MVRSRWQTREILLGIGVVAALVFILTFYIWYQTEAVRLGLQIRDCKDQIQTFKEEIQKLEINKSGLLAPQRVEKIAKESLGLIEPDDHDVIYENRGNSR